MTARQDAFRKRLASGKQEVVSGKGTQNVSGKGTQNVSGKQQVSGQHHALGTLGECVMSIYGIARSLQCRDLGPAQLLPAIDDFRAHSRRGCTVAHSFIETLQERAQDHELAASVGMLAADVRRVLADVDTLFAGARKLGAKERLELERNIVHVGGELQASHRLLVVVAAALDPRPIVLSLPDLVRGSWAPHPAFVSRRVEICVQLSAGVRFEADPQVAWAILERFMHELPADTTTVFAQVDSTDAGSAVLRLGDMTDFQRASLLRYTFDLGPRLPLEAELLDALTARLGWHSSREHDEVQIAFAAA